MSDDLVERTRAIAQEARERRAAEASPAHRWWSVKKPGDDMVYRVLVSPACTADEMRVRYPGAGVLPMTEEEVTEWRKVPV